MSIDTKFTIIIPTRDRCSTLQPTLLTCIKQDYSNFEITISDNFSDDNTKHFISALNHPKVKYINTGKRLGMSQNWEFALDSITGEYVTFLGDDDALLPGALSDIKILLAQPKPKQSPGRKLPIISQIILSSRIGVYSQYPFLMN